MRHHVTTPCGTIPVRVVCFALSVCLIIIGVTSSVGLINYANLASQAGTDSFNLVAFGLFSESVVYFFVIFIAKNTVMPSLGWGPSVPWRTVGLLGMLGGLGLVLVSYSSLPDRTPPRLQVMLTQVSIPLTIVSRRVILGVGVGIKKVICAGVVVIGLFVALVPQVFQLETDASLATLSTQPGSGMGHMFWPIMYACAVMPWAVNGVFWEKAIKSPRANALSLVFWTRIIDLMMILALFWTNFIPGFGMTSSAEEFYNHVTRFIECHLGRDPRCSDVIPAFIVYLTARCLAHIVGSLLTLYSDSIIYIVLVQTLCTPLGALFWALFKSKPFIHWAPSFGAGTTYAVIGLCIMMPGVAAFNYYSFASSDLGKKKKIDFHPLEHEI